MTTKQVNLAAVLLIAIGLFGDLYWLGLAAGVFVDSNEFFQPIITGHLSMIFKIVTLGLAIIGLFASLAVLQLIIWAFFPPRKVNKNQSNIIF